MQECQLALMNNTHRSAHSNPQCLVDLQTGEIKGNGLVNSSRTMADLKGVFGDEPARSKRDPTEVVYTVQCYFPVKEGTPGGLFWGSTFIKAGTVGDEYFMTKGHFHSKRESGEFYITVTGEGVLILMDEDRNTWTEPMIPGSVHYIPGRTAHRVANTGNGQLSFLACWPSDAGHDYETIAIHNFSARLKKINGVPTLIEDKR
jgi:glucose-6-phosphate isomerase, archaeal